MKQILSGALLFMVAVTTLLIAGCGGFQTDVRTFDTLPDNTPKAYVEFYSDESEDAIALNNNLGGGTWSVYQYEDGISKEVEGMVWDWRTKRRIAVRPGKHTFMVKLGSANPTVTVDVDEGMLVPVGVIIDLGSETYHTYQTQNKPAYYFGMMLSVEDAIPFGEE